MNRDKRYVDLGIKTALEYEKAPQPGRIETAEIRRQRAEVYGDPKICHQAIGEAWRGILRQSWQSDDVPSIDEHTVALMMAVLKCIRAATKSGHEDSYVDAISYVEIAREFCPHKVGTLENGSE